MADIKQNIIYHLWCKGFTCSTDPVFLSGPGKLFHISASCSQADSAGAAETEYEHIEAFPLGEEASYPMQFAYASEGYQWQLISEFIRTAREVFNHSQKVSIEKNSAKR